MSRLYEYTVRPTFQDVLLHGELLSSAGFGHRRDYISTFDYENSRGSFRMVSAEDLPESFLSGILKENPIAESIRRLREDENVVGPRNAEGRAIATNVEIELIWNRDSREFHYIRWDSYETVSRRLVTEEDLLSDLVDLN